LGVGIAREVGPEKKTGFGLKGRLLVIRSNDHRKDGSSPCEKRGRVFYSAQKGWGKKKKKIRLGDERKGMCLVMAGTERVNATRGKKKNKKKRM